MFRSHRFGFVLLALGVALFAGGCGDDGSDNPVNPPPTLELNSGTINPGLTYVHKFNTAGTYPYFCTIHGTAMSGSITVDASSTVSTLGISITNNTYTPNSATVDTGAVVTWTNNGSAHTVTSK
jgi:plastocyanin